MQDFYGNTTNNLIFLIMEDRFDELLKKSVTELCQTIINLETENAKLKEYRTRLLKIRNLIVPDEEKRKQGRPRKDAEEVI